MIIDSLVDPVWKRQSFANARYQQLSRGRYFMQARLLGAVQELVGAGGRRPSGVAGADSAAAGQPKNLGYP